ncbi:MotA/TolQ/ExbB proton channel [Isosphaera pallida ATCC 43644]|uniref:MotA/TolQ/ExbB proton channel n=1 Tax=Isosphaera pallida (strain ATCC 43644 / DSM 9630 / IS1B) TaxID=575540 RepID=E8R3Y0_ISOPI|nr:MotA/TolQ/ExbB proton channel family protein [Isosphaera pallida]ADV63710.1 MotA/TolQ/ExbB proton channel [Isosphaera pallida ATCC 43644]
MDIDTLSKIIDWFGYGIYGALAMLGAWGIYNWVLIHRGINKRLLSDRAAFELLNQVEAAAGGGKTIDQAIKVCQTPKYWNTALGQLIAVALANRAKGLAKIKSLMVMEFHTEIISVLEMRLASIGTIVRMGPLLGLLGTVASMIAAFARISGAEVDPKTLSGDISLALWATGSGLLIATPMMVVANHYHAKLRHLRDRTERQLQEFVERLERLDPRLFRGKAAATGGHLLD